MCTLHSTKKDDKWYVNIINVAGNHFISKVYEYDQIPATGELTLELNAGKPIKKIVLQPEGKQLETSLKNGKTFVNVPSVKVSSIVQIEL